MVVIQALIFSSMFASNFKRNREVAKRNELHRFEVMPQRWVVERSLVGSRIVGDFGKIVSVN